MNLLALDNLVRIGQLKAEPRNEAGVELCEVVDGLIGDVAKLVGK